MPQGQVQGALRAGVLLQNSLCPGGAPPQIEDGLVAQFKKFRANLALARQITVPLRHHLCLKFWLRCEHRRFVQRQQSAN